MDDLTYLNSVVPSTNSTSHATATVVDSAGPTISTPSSVAGENTQAIIDSPASLATLQNTIRDILCDAAGKDLDERTMGILLRKLDEADDVTTGLEVRLDHLLDELDEMLESMDQVTDKSTTENSVAPLPPSRKAESRAESSNSFANDTNPDSAEKES